MRSPKFIYGTAWKEDRTGELTTMALDAGFRAFDTANQRKHYFEAGMGAALKAAYAAGVVQREDLFLQTKFTYQGGQDYRLPYDPTASLTVQVEQSFESSLEHLNTNYIDSLLLHGPELRRGVSENDQEVWRAMESLHKKNVVFSLGLSNISLEQLQQLYRFAEIKPKFVQNRCFAATGWDIGVREFCARQDLTYQGFSLLTANPHAVASSLVSQLATKYQTAPEQVIFRFAQQVGMCPLTGTSRLENMRADLACGLFSLTTEEVSLVERVALSKTGTVL